MRVAALVVLGLMLGVGGPAEAGRRIVVLEFEGPKAAKFRSDVEAAVKKGNTIVSLDKWNAKAEDLGATKVNARNIKKVATKLKVDGVIVGEVEKRGSRYYLRLRLREGVSGQFVAESEIVVRAPKLGTDGARTVKDEMLPAIKELETIGGGDDDEEPVAKKKAKKTKKSGFARRDPDEEDEDEEEDDEPVAKKKAKKTKQVAKKEPKKKAKRPPPDEDDEDEDDEEDDDGEDSVAFADDDDGDEEDVEVKASRRDDGDPVPADPLYPALEIGAGLSATGRRLGFGTANGAAELQGYKGNPVAGAVFTADVYPLAFNRKNRSITRHLGLSVLFDRVISITSRIGYQDPADPNNMLTAELPTTQQRYAVGVVFRYPVGDKAAVEGRVRYNRMKFDIDKTGSPVAVTIPSVDYAFLDPAVGVRYVLSPKMIAGGGVGFLLVTNTGEMQQADQYGAARTLGFELDGGVSYAVTPKIMIRGDLRLTTLGFSFDGSGALSDPQQDGMVEVPTGRDTYFGGAATAAYLF